IVAGIAEHEIAVGGNRHFLRILELRPEIGDLDDISRSVGEALDVSRTAHFLAHVVGADAAFEPFLGDRLAIYEDAPFRQPHMIAGKADYALNANRAVGGRSKKGREYAMAGVVSADVAGFRQEYLAGFDGRLHRSAGNHIRMRELAGRTWSAPTVRARRPHQHFLKCNDG